MAKRAAVKNEKNMRTLWRGHLLILPKTKRDFLFRSSSDFQEASLLAEKLVQSSNGAEMVGARLTGIEEAGRLWN